MELSLNEEKSKDLTARFREPFNISLEREQELDKLGTPIFRKRTNDDGTPFSTSQMLKELAAICDNNEEFAFIVWNVAWGSAISKMKRTAMEHAKQKPVITIHKKIDGEGQ